MSDEGKAKGWWQTLPGIIATVTAAVTALTGLIVAINQTGWFGPRTPPTVATHTRPASAAPSRPISATPTQPPPPTTSAPQPTPIHAVGLPALRDARLGEATFTLLAAEVTPRTAEKDALQVRLRMMNHGRYDANFWDRSFRLIVDGVPMAPQGGLNELVPGESATEGDVVFVIPRDITRAMLRITHLEDSTEIPLDLPSPR